MFASLKRMPIWLWLLLVAAVPRLINLGGEALWYDESFTAWLVKLDLPSMFQALAGDTHPPLWYLVEWLNIRVLGTSEFALRLPSAIFGIVCVLLVWQVALEAGLNRRTALVAGLLTALLPSALYYSQEARMYMLLTMCVLLALWGAMRLDWRVFIIGSICAVFSQNVGLIYVLCLGIMRLHSIRHYWGKRRSMFLALVAVGIAWLPWAFIVFQQVQRINQNFWVEPLTPVGILWPLVNMTMGWRLPDILQIHIYGAALGITAIGFITARSRFRCAGFRWYESWQAHQTSTPLFMIFAPPLVLAVISIVWRSIYLPRALLPSAVLLMLFWAQGLTRLAPPNRRVAQIVLVPALLAGVVSHYFPAGQSGRFDTRAWVTPALAQWQTGDVAYFTSAPYAVSIRYYLDKPYRVSSSFDDPNQTFNEDCAKAMQIARGNFDELRRAGFKRAWLFTSLNPLSSASERYAIARILVDYPHTLIARQPATNADVALYLVSLTEGVDSK